MPADIQQYATFSSGIIAGAGQTDAAKAVVEFLTAAPIFKKRGMEPPLKSILDVWVWHRC